MPRLIAASAAVLMLCVMLSAPAAAGARTVTAHAPSSAPVTGLPDLLPAARHRALDAFSRAHDAARQLGIHVRRPRMITHTRSIARLRHARSVWNARAHHYHRLLHRRHTVIRAAVSQLGTRYTWGGSSPATGFDCSGLVMWAYGRAGIGLPHSTGAMIEVGRHISRSRIRPGDLVFSEGGGHVGMYLAGGRVIHAPHTGSSVRIDPIGSWAVVAIRRVI